MGKHVFCRDLCIERDEPLSGTAHVAQRVLLLRWPRGKWRSPRFESVDMVPALAEALRDLVMNKGCNVVLFDKVGETESLPKLIDPIGGVVADYDTDEDLIALVEAFGRGVPLKGRPDPRITVLCCTDSRTDACCARYGFAAYKAIDAAADRDKFNVVQTTHLGYCRMAGRINVLPSRHSYGRFDPAMTADFLAATEQGQPFLPFYRGSPDLSEPLQVAEVALRNWAHSHDYAADSPALTDMDVPEDPAEGEELLIDGQVADRHFKVRVKAQTYDVHGGCDQIAAAEPARNVMRWRLVGIDEAPIPR